MKRADIITFVGALIIVVIIAVVSQGPGGIPGIDGIAEFLPFVSPHESHAGAIPEYSPPMNPQKWIIPKNTDLNTIFVSGEGGYPVADFPDDMTLFGASDPEYQNIWMPGEIVQFAIYNGPGNGFSKMFQVPFRFWRINATINEVTKPESAQLTWVLVDSKSATIITGNQMRYGEHVLKTVQVSGGAFYLIVSTQDVNQYTLNLETTKAQYGNTLIQPAVQRLTAFLNAA